MKFEFVRCCYYRGFRDRHKDENDADNFLSRFASSLLYFWRKDGGGFSTASRAVELEISYSAANSQSRFNLHFSCLRNHSYFFTQKDMIVFSLLKHSSESRSFKSKTDYAEASNGRVFG